MNVTDLETVVIDNGSGVLKAGFGGDKAPKVVFSSIIGRPNDQDIKDSYIGDEAQMKRSVLNLNYPIEHGIVTNWEDMEKIWNYTFQSKLCIKAEEHRVLLTEAPLNPAEHRNKMTEIMFEVFDSPSLMVAVSGLMSLFGSGRTTGIVLDCGDGVTQCVPVKDGSVFTEAIIRCGYAGRDITDYLIKLLNDRGYSFTTSAEREIVRNIKERLCFIDSFKHEVKLSSLEKRYELPDGRTITLCDERFMCSESLFNSSFPINDRYGIHEMVNFSIKKCDECIREELYDNIVVSGGSTMYEGFPDRVEKEITAIAPNTIDIKVIHSPERKYYAWIGGSLVSCASVLNSLFVTKQEYMEFGPNIAHTKCF